MRLGAYAAYPYIPNTSEYSATYSQQQIQQRITGLRQSQVAVCVDPEVISESCRRAPNTARLVALALEFLVGTVAVC
jgi:hypothetical protein